MFVFFTRNHMLMSEKQYCIELQAYFNLKAFVNQAKWNFMSLPLDVQHGKSVIRADFGRGGTPRRPAPCISQHSTLCIHRTPWYSAW